MKHTGKALLKGIAKALIQYGSAGLIPGMAVDWLVDGGEGICTDVWEYWGKDRQEIERRQAIEDVASATAADLRDEIELIARELTADEPEKQAPLQALLHQVQPNIRRTLRRPEDQRGLTVSDWQKFDSPQSLITIVPTRTSRFRAGDRPLPGVDWVLEELLGVGGFGEVWRAINPELPDSDPVALKFCLDPQAAKSLKNEARLLNQVKKQGKHPGIVELLHTYLTADIPALEYEYVSGGDLGDLIHQWHGSSQPPDASTIRDCIREIATIMAFAHQNQIVHRDLKPANILVPAFEGNAGGTGGFAGARYRFKIADFGIGELQSRIENRVPDRGVSISRRMTESVTGSHTPLYSSPEQAAGKVRSEPGDDIYSLGVIWYQMVIGDLTVGAPTGRRWEEKLRERGMKEAEIQLLVDCFEPRADRPKTATEFLAKLEAATDVPKPQPAPQPQPPKAEVRTPEVVTKAPATPKSPATPVAPKSTPGPLEFSGVNAGDQRELVPGIKFRWCPPCPPGRFTMGTKGTTDDEAPVAVTLTRGFWLGETVVTQQQWSTLMKSKPWNGKVNVKEGPNYPATYISHGDAGTGWFGANSASQFCFNLTEQERKAGRLPAGWKYALPTEAQWEYACRAGTTTKYSFGDDENRLGEHAWFDKNAWDIGEKYAHEVGKKQANSWKLFDMHGNVWEWCADWYDSKLVSGHDPVGPSQGSDRVLRGGSWVSEASYCRSASRSGYSPDYRSGGLGLRVAGVPSSP